MPANRDSSGIEVARPRDLARLRRLALDAQGLLHVQRFGRGLNGARKAIQHLGYVQIDTISVVQRAHHHVFHSRVPGFTPAMTHQMLLDRDIFEYWSHAAAFLPIADFRFSLPYKHAIRSGRTHWYKAPDTKLMAELLARIRSDGPLRARDVTTKRKSHAGWWDWTPAKKSLEQLYMQGDLMVSARDGFQKTYDLTERVLPPHVDTRTPSLEEFAAHLVDQTLRSHGLASLRELTYLRRDAELRNAVKALVDERLAQRILQQVRLGGGEMYVMQAGALERPLPRPSQRLLILSPFDNSVIQRERLRSLFGYDYQIECYTPASKRRHGYFCLPLLYRDQFVGRMDCKAHRKTRRLEIKALHLEQPSCDDDRFVAAFADAVASFREFQECETVSLKVVRPKHLAKRLRAALEATG